MREVRKAHAREVLVKMLCSARRLLLAFLPGYSLRARIRIWVISIVGLTLFLYTATDILEEREQMLLMETAQGRGLLEHLASMPEFQTDLGTATARLCLMSGSLDAAGGKIEIVSHGAQSLEDPFHLGSKAQLVLATRELRLQEGLFELRYSADTERLWQATRRTALLRGIHGLVALVALLMGIEWIFRRNLEAPLEDSSRDVKLMGSGGGRLLTIPPTGSDLDHLAAAVKDLGPGLKEQVQQWVQAERQSGVAMALNHVLDGIRYPLLDARALAADISATGQMTPAAERKLRLLLVDLDCIGHVLQAEERLQFGGEKPSANGAAS